MNFCRCTIIIILLVFEVSLSNANEIPVGSPISDRLILIARELYGRGIINKFEYSAIGDTIAGQFDAQQRQLIDQFYLIKKSFSYGGSRTPWIAANLDAIESNRQQSSNSNFIKLFPLIRVDFNDRLSSTVLYRIDGELGRDPRYDGKTWRGVSGFPENATLDYKTNDLGIRFGLERISWGYGNYGNLMFSNQAMPMTVIGFTYHRWIFDYEEVIGFLSPIKSELDSMQADISYFTDQQRYLSAHSLTLRPVKSLSLSLREAVLYGGPGRRFEPVYTLPLLWYHGNQLNSRMDDNILMSAGLDYRLRGKFWLYGEFLVDDYQVDKSTRGDNEPNELAYLGGGEIYDMPLRKISLSFEYARVNDWTYNQGRPQNRYINNNFPVGFPTGPDGDIWNWRVSWWAYKNIRLSYTGLYRRQGEGRIDTPWTRPWLSVDNYSEKFPTGIVEKQIINGLNILAFDKNKFWGNMTLNYSDISNVGNVPGKDNNGWEFAIDVGYELPHLSWGF
jgi:hypothetical protein